MLSAVFLSFALTHLAIAAYVMRPREGIRAPGRYIIAFIGAGIAYDCILIASGQWIGAGPLLETLNWPRFALHAVFTPLLMLAAWQIAAAARLEWTRSMALYAGLWILIIGLSAYGIVFDLIGLQIQPACVGDTLRYTYSTPAPQLCTPEQVPLPGHGPPIPSILTAFVCLLAGISLWRQYRWAWLAAGSLGIFVLSGIPAASTGPVFGNGGEVLLQAALAFTAWRFADAPSPP